MSRFRSKAVEIEAVQLRWDTWAEVCALAATCLRGDGFRGLLSSDVAKAFPGAEIAEPIIDGGIYAIVPTPEGNHLARQGDWIIRGLESELYPCRDSIFQRKYEPVP